MTGLFSLRPLQQSALDGLRNSILAGEERKFYVYVLFRPCGEPFYVGMGSGRRWLKHEWRSHNPHVSAIIKQAGGEVPKVRVRSWLTADEAVAVEIALIAAIGRESHGGPLVNLTDGGEGVVGFAWTAEQRAKMSERRKGNGYWGNHKFPESAREKIRTARIGKAASEETKARMSAAHSGRTHSVETRGKMSASQTGEKHAMFGRKHSEEAKIRIRSAMKGVPKSEETRARMSAAMVMRYAAAREAKNAS